MAKNKKKKQQKRIAKIIADGRVTAKEARKAQKQGISLARIQKAQTKSFKPGNVFSKPGTAPSTPNAREVARGTYKAPAKPAYTPLVIQGSAQKVFDQGRAAAAPGPGPSPGPGPTTGPEPGPKPVPVDPTLQALMDQNALLTQRLDAMPDFEALFAQQAEQAAQQRADDLAQMQQQQALAMEEMAARQAEQERQRLLTAQTQQANMARAGLRPDFSIGGRQSDLYGTSGFKRRRRIRPATIAQGIAPTTPTAGATNGNLLNV